MMKTLSLKRMTLSFIAFALFIGYASAQQSEIQTDKDSINTVNLNYGDFSDFLFPKSEFREYLMQPAKPANLEQEYLIRQFDISKTYYPVFVTEKAPLHVGEYSKGGIIKGFRNSALIGSGSQENLIGLGVINTASVTYFHRVNDRLYFTGQVDAVKYNVPRNTSATFGIGGTMFYQINDILAFHAFANYYVGKSLYATGNLYSSKSFGGYLTIEMGDHFGMGLGAQHYYSPNLGRWQTDPIVMPYFKLNNGAQIGFDVGGILKQTIKDAINNKRMNINTNTRSRYNATIMPERPPIIIR